MTYTVPPTQPHRIFYRQRYGRGCPPMSRFGVHYLISSNIRQTAVHTQETLHSRTALCPFQPRWYTAPLIHPLLPPLEDLRISSASSPLFQRRPLVRYQTGTNSVGQHILA